MKKFILPGGLEQLREEDVSGVSVHLVGCMCPLSLLRSFHFYFFSISKAAKPCT